MFAHVTTLPTTMGDLRVLHGEGRPDLVLWPGLFFDHRLHLPLANALGERGLEVALVQSPGYGGSTLAKPRFQIRECGAAYIEVLEAMGWEGVAIGGTSWGGMSAMHAALIEPARIAALVLMNAPFWGGSRQGLMGVAPTMARHLPVEAFAAATLPSVLAKRTLLHHPGPTFRALADALRDAKPADREATALSVLQHRESLRPHLAELRTPALVIAGPEDSLCPLKPMTEGAAALPQGQLLVVPGTGHLSALEDPARCANAIESFLVGLAG